MRVKRAWRGRADNMRLVKAVLVAGLYPNVARVDAGGGKPGDGKKPKLTTRSADGKSGALPAPNLTLSLQTSGRAVLADIRACRHAGAQPETLLDTALSQHCMEA